MVLQEIYTSAMNAELDANNGDDVTLLLLCDIKNFIHPKTPPKGTTPAYPTGRKFLPQLMEFLEDMAISVMLMWSKYSSK